MIMSLKKIWEYLWKALFNNDDGFSVRKTVGVMFSIFIIVLTARFTTDDNFEYVLTNYLATILTLFGITTIANNQRRKSEIKAQIEMQKVNPDAKLSPEKKPEEEVGP